MCSCDDWRNANPFLRFSSFSFISPLINQQLEISNSLNWNPAAKKIKSTPKYIYIKIKKTPKHVCILTISFMLWATLSIILLREPITTHPPLEYNLCKIPVGLVQQVEMLSFPHKNIIYMVCIKTFLGNLKWSTLCCDTSVICTFS